MCHNPILWFFLQLFYTTMNNFTIFSIFWVKENVCIYGTYLHFTCYGKNLWAVYTNIVTCQIWCDYIISHVVRQWVMYGKNDNESICGIRWWWCGDGWCSYGWLLWIYIIGLMIINFVCRIISKVLFLPICHFQLQAKGSSHLS